MPLDYTFSIKAKDEVSQVVNKINGQLAKLGKDKIPLNFDVKGMSDQVGKAVQTGAKKIISSSSRSGGLFGSSGVNQSIRQWTQAAEISNRQGTKATRQMTNLITASADQTQAKYSNALKFYQLQLSRAKTPETQDMLQGKINDLTMPRASAMTSNYAKQLSNLTDTFDRSVSKVQQKGRSFANNIDLDKIKGQIASLGDAINSEETWGGNKPQEVAQKMASLQSQIKSLSDPQNIFMDNASISKYAQKMSRSLDGQMKRDTRNIGKNYMSQLQDALEGNSSITQKDWRANYIPNMETFMARASKENNGATGFFKRMGSSLKGQNAALIGSLFSTQSLTQMAKTMASATTRVDDAMVELRKVSDASPQRLAQDKRVNAQTAQTYGTTLSDAIQSTASWSRLGNSIDDAEKLAKVSAEFQAVGDNMNETQIQQALTSVQRAWKQTPEQLKRSLDSINEICLLSAYCKRYEAIG